MMLKVFIELKMEILTQYAFGIMKMKLKPGHLQEYKIYHKI